MLSQFDRYSLDLETGELCRDGKRIDLRPQATTALQMLVHRSKQLVTHDELRREIWGDTSVEWDTGLHQVIRQVRRALQDDARNPTYIETVPRRGYRFRVEPTSEKPQRRQPPTSRRRDALLVLGGSLALPVMVVVFCVLVALG